MAVFGFDMTGTMVMKLQAAQETEENFC